MLAENIGMIIVLVAFAYVVYGSPAPVMQHAISNYAIGFGFGLNAVTKWYTWRYDPGK